MKFINYIVVVIVFATVNGQNITCPDGEVRVSCKNECQPTCNNPTPSTNCSVCKQGCVCQPHLIRETKSDRCIPASKCPKNNTCKGENVEFNWCASWCPKTCQSPCRKPVLCIASCNQRCDCKPGFLLDEISLKCVEPSKCPSCKCPDSEIWTQCKSKCEKTCYSTIKKPQNCVAGNSCSPGCICPKGCVRNEKTGKCIPLNKCYT